MSKSIKKEPFLVLIPHSHAVVFNGSFLIFFGKSVHGVSYIGVSFYIAVYNFPVRRMKAQKEGSFVFVDAGCGNKVVSFDFDISHFYHNFVSFLLR